MRRKGSAYFPLLLPLVFIYGGSACASSSLFVVVVSLRCFMWHLFLRHDPPLSRVIMKDWLVPSSETLASPMMPFSIHCFLLPVVSCMITLSPGLIFSELFFPGLLASFVSSFVQCTDPSTQNQNPHNTGYSIPSRHL